MDKDIIGLEKRIEDLENDIKLNPYEDYSEEYYSIEDEYNEIENFTVTNIQEIKLNMLRKRINSIKADIDPYDAEGERAAMFPNGEDD
jgi:hypothetical protein